MKSTWKLPKLIYRTAMLKLSHADSDQTADYDTAAASYDAYYSQNLGKSALGMLQKLPVGEGQYVLDLACGTGFFTHRLAGKVGERGRVVAVDLSAGMLQRNQETAAEQGFSNITFVRSDALSFLSGIADSSADGVVCAWGICYMDHGKFIREVERVVKPGGFLGILENKASSLKEISDLFSKVILDFPEAMIKNVNLNLPKDKNYLVKKFGQGKFRVQEAWEGQVLVPCQNGDEVAEYMTKSGAAAGFIDALDKKLLPEVMRTFVSYADRRLAMGKPVPVRHEFCALVGIKA
ncbi:class I SAM-dependent methyltransferase [Kamptonema formosum]|uniref:class I SAM-dependent methyltransferase n=1 Tax=Kamptonema formosum TaxID=331992 RepID=UPI00035D3896|nr:class I SAM-dependent methyltransferase [Oscillatoria sp. PCC 10802]